MCVKWAIKAAFAVMYAKIFAYLRMNLFNYKSIFTKILRVTIFVPNEYSRM